MHLFHLRATTVLARTSRSLLQALKTRPPPRHPRNHILYCLSLDASPDLTSSLPAALGESSIGCLSAPLPSHPDKIVCSLLEVPYGMGQPFISSIPGRPPSQVGRYHSMHKSNNIDAWDQSEDSYRRAMGEISGATDETQKHYEIPTGLSPIQQNIQTFIYLSDLAPEGLVKSLDHYYPHSMKTGLLSASTPFITGSPVTLFANGETLTSGAVGIGIFSQFEKLSHGFEGLKSLSDTLTVTSAQGNLVHTLDGVNPSQLLTKAITSLTSSAANPKDDDFYLGLLSSDGKTFRKIYTITSGDPKRGSLALEGEDSPPEGSSVKLLSRSTSTSSDPSQSSIISTLASRKQSLSFLTSSKEAIPQVNDAAQGRDDGVIVLNDTFLAASENGLLLNHQGERTWRSGVEGGWANMSWFVPETPPST